jgi:hypothetical protein
MVLRWMVAGMGEAAKQFRRVNGHLHLPVLDQTIVTDVTPRKEDATWSPAGRRRSSTASGNRIHGHGVYVQVDCNAYQNDSTLTVQQSWK